jgi:multidrug efflux pump subunit AcrB
MRFVPDESSLEYYGVSRDALSSTLATLLGGQVVGVAQRPYGGTPLDIRVQLDKPARTLDGALLATPVATPKGTVELGELGTLEEERAGWPIFRHNGHNAEMVQAELAGRYEAPIYGMLAVDSALADMDWGTLGKPAVKLKGQPMDETHPTLLWDGEWEITATTFTDMGIAFAVALLGIYLLVVGQFGSFKLPLVILLPIPLSLLGIILGHALLRANFTAPSMIGFIALAGIIVRNSILLVDFIRHTRKPGSNVAKVVMEAGAIRVKPIILTALAAMIGAVFIITDPIFQGLAVSLLFGLLSSTALTLLAVPAVYVVYFKSGLETPEDKE